MHKMRGRIFCMLFLVLCAHALSAQQHRFGAGYRHGFILMHHQEMRDAYGDKWPNFVELTWLKATTGDEEWQRVWNYPDIGINLGLIDLRDPGLGKTIYSTIFLQKYIGKRTRDLRFSFKVAPGLSYTTETYEVEDNEDNTFISTPFNFVMEGNFLAHYRISPHMDIYGGVFFTHYSNGGVKLPNSGFNIASVGAGITYQPVVREPSLNRDPVSDIERKFSVNVMYAGSAKSDGEDTNELRFAWTLSTYADWRVNHRSGLTAGTDVMYNATIPERVGDPDANPYRIGIHAGHDLVAGPTSVLFQLGYYVYRPVDIDKSVYWRLGVKQSISSRVFAGIFLKAHMGRADVIEFGLGYQL